MVMFVHSDMGLGMTWNVLAVRVPTLGFLVSFKVA